MQRLLSPILTSLLLAVVTQAAVPTEPPPADLPPESLPGGYREVDREAPDVLAARDEAQRANPSLTIEQVLQAYTQVVAGMNYKLVCQVLQEGQETQWRFIVWHKLDGTWEVTRSEKLLAGN